MREYTANNDDLQHTDTAMTATMVRDRVQSSAWYRIAHALTGPSDGVIIDMRPIGRRLSRIGWWMKKFTFFHDPYGDLSSLIRSSEELDPVWLDANGRASGGY